MDKIQLIKTCTLFSDLSEASISKLVAIADTKIFNKNEFLFSEDDIAKALYILANGKIDLIKSSPNGKEQLIRTVQASEVFAEAAVFSGEKYPVTAIAKEKSVVFIISKDRFLKFIKTDPEVALKMMGTMSNLLRHLNSLISGFTLGTVSSRLASYLVKKVETTKNNTFLLDVKKQDLAFQLGTISETLSRTLKQMSIQGLIIISKNKIVVKNLSDLKKMANLT